MNSEDVIEISLTLIACSFLFKVAGTDNQTTLRQNILIFTDIKMTTQVSFNKIKQLKLKDDWKCK